MDAYTGFAEVYDLFMDQVPYEKWSRRITEILKEYGIPDKKQGLHNCTENY